MSFPEPTRPNFKLKIRSNFKEDFDAAASVADFVDSADTTRRDWYCGDGKTHGCGKFNRHGQFGMAEQRCSGENCYDSKTGSRHKRCCKCFPLNKKDFTAENFPLPDFSGRTIHNEIPEHQSKEEIAEYEQRIKEDRDRERLLELERQEIQDRELQERALHERPRHPDTNELLRYDEVYDLVDPEELLDNES